MSLTDYLHNGWIREHSTSPQEIANLFAIADRDLRQSRLKGLVAEWRFDIAYNAALQAMTAVLAAAGYRAGRDSKHRVTVECMEFALGLPRDEIRFWDICRQKRNSSVYDQIGAVSDGEVTAMIAKAGALRRRAAAWVAERHPHLLRGGR